MKDSVVVVVVVVLVLVLVLVVVVVVVVAVVVVAVVVVVVVVDVLIILIPAFAAGVLPFRLLDHVGSTVEVGAVSLEKISPTNSDVFGR